MRNPYEVLGVSKNASEADIKKAFRTLAKKHHPDTKGGDTAAQKRFQEISAAYEIVGDKEKRAKFDSGQIDANGNAQGFDPRQHGFRGNPFGGGGQGPGGFNWSTQDDGSAGGFRAEDIFADIFGGMAGGGRARGRGNARAPQRGEDFSVSATVSFEEAARGGERRVVLPNGEQIDVKIPSGMKDGQQIRLKGRGGAGRAGGPAGDVLIQVSVAPHPFFSREGNNLKLDLEVSLREAVLGGKVPVPTLSGSVHLSIPPNSNSGSVLRLKGKGIPARGAETAGDLYVRLIISLPEKPDADLTRFVEGWNNPYDPRRKSR